MELRVAIVFLTGISIAVAAGPLDSYNVSTSEISVSGVSSGACMATQMHVAFSEKIMGAGLIGGIPYYCAQGSMMTALYTCMTPGNYDVQELIDIVHEFGEDDRYLDHPTNMLDDRVYIFHGTEDNSVEPINGPNTVEFYTEFVNAGNIITEFGIEANKGFPTEDYGSSCSVSRSPYLNRCEYHAAYQLLNYIYGGDLVMPSGSVPVEPLMEFDQSEFLPSKPPGGELMDDTGFLYVPSECKPKDIACRLHVVFHACTQGRGAVGDEFAVNAGYLEVAELNNIILLFPQVKRNSLSNPNGCFDWWGYTDSFYATKQGEEMVSVNDMIDRICDEFEIPPDPCFSSPYHQMRLSH